MTPREIIRERVEAMGKETLYQVLGIAATASAAEVEAGYRQALEKLDAAADDIGREEGDFRRKLIVFARDTLSDPVSRMGYDEKLMARRMPAPGDGRKALTPMAMAG